ncbi:MAG TPA: helix-turn-helix domain-containing protein [Yinghuangia sp.]|nr:helix-turn-helix domain-containing protein [Yinghuangia sp.]
MRIGDKWTGRILACLESGPRRFSEIHVPLRNVTPKVLTESLRAMERDGIITRTAYPEIPPRVEYELTDLGRRLYVLMQTCCGWTRQHGEEIAAARRAYEERSRERRTAASGTAGGAGHAA